MKWLITGGCGFIGKGLVEKLLAHEGHNIRVMDNLSVGRREDLAGVAQNFCEVQVADIAERGPEGIELLVADILDEDAAMAAATGIDIIVHFAANTGVGPSVENPRSDCLTNVIGTLNMLEAARHSDVKRFVFASSGAPIGECVPPIHEELAPHPVSPYGASKLAGEGYCSVYFRTYGVETVALRFGNVYGPGSTHKSSVVAKFIRQATNGEVLEIFGDGSQTRDFIFLDDLLDAVIKAATVTGIGGETFQIATNQETTVNELVEKLLLIFADAGFKEVKVQFAGKRLGDVMRNFSDTSKAKKQLGWVSSTETHMGLQRTFQSYLNS